MIDVYLVRHAFAAHRDPSRWPDDAKRPLTERGIARFRREARGLRALVPRVDAVHSSSFARAWQTAELLQAEIGWPAPQPCSPIEVGRSPSEVVPLLETLRDSTSVALVGHEPHLSSLASLLVAGDEGALRLEVKKGAVVRLAFATRPGPGRAVMRWSVSPKILRLLDGGRT
jgi:phosphohistidine phosphatase